MEDALIPWEKAQIGFRWGAFLAKWLPTMLLDTFDPSRPHSWASVRKPLPSGKLLLETCLKALDMAVRHWAYRHLDAWHRVSLSRRFSWVSCAQAEVVGCG